MNLTLGRIFLSYASEDRARVLRLYENLKTAGFQPWIDTRDIPKGSDWDSAIHDAIRASGVFVACISRSSASKGGVLAGEIDAALTARKGRGVLLIPVRLDETPVPDRLRRIQWVDLKDDESWRDVAAVIRAEEARLTRRRWLVAASAAIPAVGLAGYLYWRRGSAGMGAPRAEAAAVAVNLLRIRRARPGDTPGAAFTMSPTPHNGLTSPTLMCTEQIAAGAEIESSDLVLLRLFSSQAGHVYVVDQEMAPEPKRPILLVDGVGIQAGETISLPPSPAGAVSYFRFAESNAFYTGEQLTIFVAPYRLQAQVDRSTGAPVLSPADWETWQREYPFTGGAPGAQFQNRLVPEDEGSKEIQVETASATYRAQPGSGVASARILLRVRRL